jgi:hypothetical protein
VNDTSSFNGCNTGADNSSGNGVGNDGNAISSLDQTKATNNPTEATRQAPTSPPTGTSATNVTPQSTALLCTPGLRHPFQWSVSSPASSSASNETAVDLTSPETSSSQTMVFAFNEVTEVVIVLCVPTPSIAATPL